MIAAMPKKAVRAESDARQPRTGPVTAAKFQEFITEVTDILTQAKQILPMFDLLSDKDLIVDGVNMIERGPLQCGLFVDNVRSAIRRAKRSR